MSGPTVSSQSYGKSKVRLSRVFRDQAGHQIVDWMLSIALEGDFDAAYTQADNSKIVATDTMKNTVYVLAARHAVRSMEGFAQLLAEHFLRQYSHVVQVSIACEEQPWTRIHFAGRPHPYAFLGGSSERYTCNLVSRADGEAAMTSGLAGLQVLKTTGSAFSGFARDEYTTLADAEDRILATSIEASWPCRRLDADWSAARQQIRTALVDVFAHHDSKSLQHTLYEMGRAAFAACELVDEISIRLPNQHHLPVNLAPFGIAGRNEVFVPTSEPFGDIRATLCRDATEAESS